MKIPSIFVEHGPAAAAPDLADFVDVLVAITSDHKAAMARLAGAQAAGFRYPLT